jgi:hypothetical protein
VLEFPLLLEGVGGLLLVFVLAFVSFAGVCHGGLAFWTARRAQSSCIIPWEGGGSVRLARGAEYGAKSLGHMEAVPLATVPEERLITVRASIRRLLFPIGPSTRFHD